MTNQLLNEQNTISFEDPEVVQAKAKLKELLPNIRKMAGCPLGSDEDILSVSYPPYFTSCPNPFIDAWLKNLDRPSDIGREDPGPFSSDVSEGKGNQYYKAHAYPTKVPHPAIMRFILHYTKPGDVVLDGFCGTGMTGVAALACGNPDLATRQQIESEFKTTKVQWGTRRAVLADLSPTATFISAGLNLPIPSSEFKLAAENLISKFEKKYGWIYKTKVEIKSGSSTTIIDGDIDYTVWSEVFTCPHCGNEIVFFDAAFDHENGKVKDVFNCQNCHTAVKKSNIEERKTKIKTIHGDINEKLLMRPVAIHWRKGKESGFKKVDDSDLLLLEKIKAEQTAWFPSHDLPWLHRVHNWAIPDKGFHRVHHFWSDRALLTLSALWELANEVKDTLVRNGLKFWIEQGCWGLSWLNRYVPTHFSHVNQYLTGVYYIPSLHAESSFRYGLVGTRPSTGKMQSLAKLWNDQVDKLNNVYISTGSSTALGISENSIDYIFVDPPFGENLYYSDLAYLNESWHRIYTNTNEEAIVDKNKTRPKSKEFYGGIISLCFKEFYRVLKPGRWMTVEFSNSSNEIWLLIQHSLASAGFVVADTRIIDKQGYSFSQIVAENAVKHDLVISAYKPADETEKAFQISAGAPDGAWAFVREHLRRTHPTEGERGKACVVRERQADRIYERMVAYHVARNTLVPMTASEFYSGLDQRFPVRDSMYFLPDQVEAYERFRITFKDLATQSLFIRDESSAVQWLRQQLKDKPRTFAELQPIFMREMQAGIAAWEELPDLKSMLDDNFILDDRGRWAVPDPKKSEHLDQIRVRALLKEFGTYLSGRGPLGKFRTEAIRAGFKDAWSRKDFSTIVAVGRRLPSDVFIEDSSLLHYFHNAERLAG